jgi:ABC-2 type transport system ATP-binding protein
MIECAHDPIGVGGIMAAILEVHNLVKKYGDLTAVNDVSFSIEEGEIFSLLGPNGAGKTTTISVVSCLLQPTSGDAIIGGHSVTRESMEVRKIIGVVPQDIALYHMLSARENLAFWGRMYGMGGAQLKKRVDEVLEQIGLTDKANVKVGTYSGGMKRRVNIGVGFCIDRASSTWTSRRWVSIRRAAVASSTLSRN